MLSFPSIGREIREDIEIFAFDKLDGTNVQALWEWEEGFTCFGTRKRPILDDDPVLGEAITLIKQNYSGIIRPIFENHGVAQATCFFEFFGECSFAGRHRKEPHKVRYDI